VVRTGLLNKADCFSSLKWLNRVAYGYVFHNSNTQFQIMDKQSSRR